MLWAPSSAPAQLLFQVAKQAMTRPIPAIWLLLASNLGMFALACEPGGVGDPCIPEDEYLTSFTGYGETEVNVESRSFQCETRVCLVNHFRGRVSCPYGQTADDLKLPGNDPRRCRVPGTSGADPNDVVAVEVPAQLITRSAAASPQHAGGQDAVYCSCRCANADGSKDDGARYCDCPDGFSCTPLVDDLGFGSKQLAGSYCIHNGTKYNPAQEPPPPKDCSPALCCDKTAKNCGNDGNNP
jgi:hypothetical protein